jgi:hypothetical protein
LAATGSLVGGLETMLDTWRDQLRSRKPSAINRMPKVIA